MVNEDVRVPNQVELDADNLESSNPFRDLVGVAATVGVVVLKVQRSR